MGFDLARFNGEVDEEFQCSICSMVLENPVQSPCDHLFCWECIDKWLPTNPSCPIDRIPLTITDLEPIHRSLRNLLNKLEIKCGFDSQGCNAVVKLEGLERHVASCEYNPDVLIVCDKGCNLEMSLREYQTSNCLAHLADNHKKEIDALVQELSNQKEHSVRQDEEIGRLRREKDQLEGVTNRQQEENKKLSEELHQLRQQQNQFEASVQRQEPEILNLNERTEISLKPPMEWEFSWNIKSPSDQTDVLEIDDKSRGGYARSFHALEPKNSSFKVHVLSGDWFGVGLSFEKETNAQLDEWFASYYNGICRTMSLKINKVEEYSGPKCKIGDIIELGIKFPLNFVNDGNTSVEFYLSINERVVKEKVVKMPNDAIYPTIIMYDSDTKIKYFGI